MGVTKPYKLKWFGDVQGPKPYNFIGFGWAFISQTPVLIASATPGNVGTLQTHSPGFKLSLYGCVLAVVLLPLYATGSDRDRSTGTAPPLVSGIGFLTARENEHTPE